MIQETQVKLHVGQSYLFVNASFRHDFNRVLDFKNKDDARAIELIYQTALSDIAETTRARAEVFAMRRSVDDDCECDGVIEHAGYCPARR